MARAPRLFTILATTGILLASCATANALSTKQFIDIATMNNDFTIKSSQLALEKSQNERIRTTAQAVIDEQTKLADTMKMALTNANLAGSEPGLLDNRYEVVLSSMKKQSDEDFDEAYIDAQVEAYEKSTALYRDYARAGENDALKEFSASFLPQLKESQQAIDTLEESLDD